MNDVGSPLDGVHRRNLAKVLRLVHHQGPLSRSELTRATGLNRSTVAGLVGELVQFELVEERPPDPTRRVGRPSPMVAATDRAVALAVNPEVDAVTLAAVSLGGHVVVRQRVPYDHLVGPDETVRLVRDTLAQWRGGPLAGARVVSVGFAIPGLVRASDGLVRWVPHLEWEDVPLGGMVEAATGLPVVVGNDASLGALAEHLFGAGRGVDDMVYLNGGASGIGGGLVVRGYMVGGAEGYAGEFGQNRPGIADGADRRAAGGVLEDEVRRDRLLTAVALDDADEPALARALAAAEGDDVAAEVERQRRILATALGNAINVLNPAMVVLGGFLATLVERDPEAFAAAVAEQCVRVNAEGVRIRVAELGEDRLMIGAAEAAFGGLLSDPEAFQPK